jgi:hypothetical protein
MIDTLRTIGIEKGRPFAPDAAQRAGRSSQSPGLVTNPDGSVTLYFGPDAPAGNEANWAPTAPGAAFEVMMRFYGPEKALFDKTWVLPDIEPVA